MQEGRGDDDGHQEVPQDGDHGSGEAWPRDYDEQTRRRRLLDILRRLPAKSVLRFRCVSRRWDDMISNRNFQFAHAASAHPVSGLFYHTNTTKPAYAPFCRATASLPDHPLSFTDEPVDVKACTRGLLCCRGRRSQEYYVCNPATGISAALPRQSNLHGLDTAVVLVFDDPHATKLEVNFQVVCAYPDIKDLRRRVYGFETFSSAAWRWTASKLTVDEGRLFPGSGVAIGRQACWRTTKQTVVVYDPTKDQRSTIGKGRMDLDGVMWWELGELDDQLCMTYVRAAPTSQESPTVEVQTIVPREGRYLECKLSRRFGFRPGLNKDNLRPLRMHGEGELLLWDGNREIFGRDMDGWVRRLLVDDTTGYSVDFLPYTSSILHVKGGSKRKKKSWQ